MVKTKSKSKHHPPWIDDTILKWRRAKTRFYRQGINEKVKFFNCLIEDRITKRKANFVNSKLNNELCPRRWWNHVNVLLNRKTKRVTNLSPTNLTHLDNEWITNIEAVEKLCEYFVSITNATNVNEPQVVIPFGNCMRSPTSDEVLLHLSRIKEHKSSGISNIPPWLLKNGRYSILQPFISIIDNIFSNRNFPDVWKCAKIRPIPKKASPSSCADFRPISLLEILSKIVEKFICNRYIHGLSLPNQHAYVQNGGTTNALISIFDKWTAALDAGSPFVRAFLIDMSRAFDKMRPALLLPKQIDNHIDPGLIALTQSFLKNRKQFVDLQGTSSKEVKVTGGVPQGSVLGPWLWLTYISDLNPDSDCDIYADDITLSIFSKNKQDIHLKAQMSMECVQQWCLNNNMTLSANKTVELVVSAGREHQTDNLVVGSSHIRQVDCVKLLGVIVDNHLTFKAHVQSCRKKAMQRIFWLRTLKRHGGSAQGLIRLYCSCIRSIFEYASPAWFPLTSKMTKSVIERVEKCALKAIHPELSYEKALLKSNTVPILVHLNNMTLNQFLKMSKTIHPLHHLIPHRQIDTSQRETRGSSRLRVPRSRLRIRKKSFVLYATQLFNSGSFV